MAEILSRGQRHAVLARLRDRWPASDGQWWHPIDVCGGSETLLLQTAWFEREADLRLLRDHLGSGMDQFVWQLAEGTPHWDDDPPDDPIGQDYLFELGEAPLAIGASETIWVPTSLAWLIYAMTKTRISSVASWFGRCRRLGRTAAGTP
jgi:hypothetical protein